MRITPAHAGKTAYCFPAVPASWDHPRSRGENRKGKRYRDDVLGSPPLTRGKPLCRPNPTIDDRITPAHAGKTATGTTVRMLAWDHPRSRGENVLLFKSRCSTLGSPPLTRGKQGVSHAGHYFDRITPAHAGKTGRRSRAAGW